MTTIEQLRFNMIEQQIRPCDVLEARILELLNQVKREHFVPTAQRSMAFFDLDIPLGFKTAMWQPKLEARVVQELHVTGADRVLEIGSGSGYLTALLASLAQHVTSVEIVPELHLMAQQHLAPYRFENITLAVGDGAQGYGDEKYDVIVLTASTPVLPAALQNALKVGGRMFAIVGDAPAMQARLIRCVAPGVFETVTIMETSVAPLQNAAQPERFIF
jgi:protein-L-isoaspartate(D-aspartate) O-methyltransferase